MKATTSDTPRNAGERTPLTVEALLRVHLTADSERQEAALRAWAAALTGSAADQVATGRLLTLTEAAERAGVSRPLLYRVISRRILHVIYPYPGSRPRLAETDLMQWIRGRRSEI